LPLITKKQKFYEKKYLSLSILIASLILLLANFITVENYDSGFYMRIIANLFIVLAMITRIFDENRKSESK
jgi:hypothetical protein